VITLINYGSFIPTKETIFLEQVMKRIILSRSVRGVPSFYFFFWSDVKIGKKNYKEKQPALHYYSQYE